MDAKLKAKWVKALRSGRYRQAQKIIGTHLGPNCCLGVLCRVAGVRRDDWYGKHTGREDLPVPLLERFGITPRCEQRLIDMNDGGEDFARIADYIEKNL